MSHSTDHSGASHGSVKTYMTGFILSIILTVIPFWMVMTGAASPAVILGTILAMAVVQVLVHLVCFLHMNTKSDEGWRGSPCHHHPERNHRQNDRQDKACHVGFYAAMGRAAVIGRMTHYIAPIR